MQGNVIYDFLKPGPGKMMKRLTRSLLSLFLFLNPISAIAFETDQFNLPSAPLADIGDEVSEYVSDNIKQAVASLNTRIAKHGTCLDASAGKSNRCGGMEEERKILAYLRSDEAVSKEVFKQLGDGIFPLSHIGNWLSTHRFRAKPSKYKTSYQDSIYILSPTNYITISPTVRLCGSEFGTDKIEHLFQQGYAYYRIYKKAFATGLTAEDSTRRAIKWGQMTERTYFGSLVSGVFSNADLYANYVGLKFYMGLTQPLTIGGVTRRPVLKLSDGLWTINADTSTSILKPFISDHLNEAFNPSGFNGFLFPSVKKVVRKHSCPQWREFFKTATATEMDAKSRSLRVWNGEDYGFTEKSRVISVGQMCFADAK